LRHGLQVACGIEGQVALQRGIDSEVLYIAHQQQVPIPRGRRAGDRFGGDIACRPAPILDDEVLSKPFAEPLSQGAGDKIERPAGCKADQ